MTDPIPNNRQSGTHPACLPPQALDAQCRLTTTRRSGPGGQHRNKVESAVVLSHPTGVAAEANERRSQHQNRRIALHRLRVNLALEVRGGAAPESRPSQLWRSRVVGRRVNVNRQHDDFPALLAEALDTLGEVAHDVRTAAVQLGVTASQLVKFLALEPRALAAVNAERSSRGLRPLRP